MGERGLGCKETTVNAGPGLGGRAIRSFDCYYMSTVG